MKTVQINNLVEVIAKRSEVPFTTDNFADFNKYLNDASKILCRSCADLIYLQEHGPATMADVNVTLPKTVACAMLPEFTKRFATDEVFFCDDEDSYESIEETRCDEVTINYVLEEQSYAELFDYLKEVCAEYGCKSTVMVADGDEQTYCKHDVSWHIDASGYKSNDSYFEIVDDGADELVASVGWLCATFINETFESFNKLGVKIIVKEA